MSRPLRIEYPGALYHITARGNAKQDIFFSDEDCHRFLELLGREIDQQRWLCHAYCLMGNHYHLLIETPEANLVKGMSRLNSVYTQYVNRRHERVGHLFQGRYKSIVVEKEGYLKELCRYIVLNPVRAGLVESPELWRWSSFRTTMGLDSEPVWLYKDWLLTLFGENGAQMYSNYHRFVLSGVDSLSPWSKLHGQMWLGSNAFKEEMESRLLDQNLNDIADEQCRPTRPEASDLMQNVEEMYKINSTHLLSRTHRDAYRAAVFLLRRAVNLSLKEVADIFHVSASRISRIQSEMERRSEDKNFQQLCERYKVKR